MTVSQDDKEAIAMLTFTIVKAKGWDDCHEKYTDDCGGMIGILERVATWALALEVMAKFIPLRWGEDLEWYDAIDALADRFLDNPMEEAEAAATAALRGMGFVWKADPVQSCPGGYIWLVVSEGSETANITGHATIIEANEVAYQLLKLQWPLDAPMPDSFDDAQRMMADADQYSDQWIDVRTLSLPKEASQ